MGTMNRRQWLRSGGTLLAGGLTLATSGFLRERKTLNEIRRDLKTSRRFVSDHDFMRLYAQEPMVRLMANENPFGPSRKVKDALKEAINSGFQYPVPAVFDLAEMILSYEDLTEEHFLMTAGSTDILTGAGIYFTSMGGNIIAGDPTYADMPAFAEELGGEVRWVPLTDDYKLDLVAMENRIDENTKLLYIVNPNNPTATVIDNNTLREFVKRVSARVPVLIDEAYIEYLDDPDTATMTDLVRDGYNVIVIRTLSKLYGFAGIRFGYGFAQPEMAKNLMMHSRGHFGISVAAAVGAMAAYRDFDFLNEAKTKTKDSKEYLYSVLEGEGYEYIPSSTNFVMFPINMPGERFVDEMTKRGVLVRNWEFDDQQWCRVSVGTMPQMEAFAKAFKQIS